MQQPLSQRLAARVPTPQAIPEMRTPQFQELAQGRSYTYQGSVVSSPFLPPLPIVTRQLLPEGRSVYHKVYCIPVNIERGSAVEMALGANSVRVNIPCE